LIPDQIRSTRLTADPWSAVGNGQAVALFAGLLLPLALFGALAASVAGPEPRGWDRDALRLSYRYYDPAIAGPLEVILNVGIGLGAAIAVGAVAVSLAKRKWGQALFWTLAVGGVLALDPLLKSIFDRPPIGDLGGDYSFPSGNAMASVVIVGAMALSSAPPWRGRTLALGVPIIVAYGVVLVYQLWHYPSDVVAGWCIAVAWMTALWLGLGRARGELRSTPGQAPAR
jgi:membrane-associated phospholipid phosphatase